MHKESYPSYAQPGHSRWKQAILEKLGRVLIMKERYDDLNADSSKTFQELLGI